MKINKQDLSIKMQYFQIIQNTNEVMNLRFLILLIIDLIYLENIIRLINMKALILLIFVVSTNLVMTEITYTSASPVWLTSPYMRAGNQNVISTYTPSGSDPKYTFTFSSAFNTVPNLAYGIKNYRPNDYMGVQCCEVNRLSLTTSTFTVVVYLRSASNLWLMNVPYIAVDSQFPHHLNSFDSVPINYSSTLVNVTEKQSYQTVYTNVINYTQQTQGKKYTKFGLPLQSNKILLYISAFHIWATFHTSTTYYPIDFDVSYKILTQDTYSLTLKLNTMIYTDELWFSQIIFNSDDVLSSKKYFIVFDIWKTPGTAATADLLPFYKFPAQFRDNFIMGLTGFQATDGQCGFQYQYEYKTINGQYGVQIQNSTSYTGFCGFSQMTSTIFYMMTWQCQSPNIYFNLTTGLCQNACWYYFYANTTINQCQPCPLGCTQCNDSITCTSCNTVWDHRVLVQIDFINYCLCQDGFYDDLTHSACVSCSKSVNNCLSCFYNPNYKTAPPSVQYGCTKCQSDYFLQIRNSQCVSYTICDSTQELFVNKSTNICQKCSLQYCVICSSLSTCTQCDASLNYFVNSTTQVCRYCDYIEGCSICSSNTTCKTCNQSLGYFINIDTSLCTNCSVGCINCDSRSNYKCTQCLDQFTLSNGVCSCHFGSYLNKISLKCQACSGICQSCVGPSDYQCKSCYGNQNRIQIKQSNGLVSCICNPYNYVQADNGSNVCVKKSQTACDFGYIFMKSKNKCMQVCGDGLVLTQNQCDDGNLVNGDGCSDQCLIQSDFTCSNQLRKPSTCIFVGSINIVGAQAYKNPFGNFITIYCQLSPIKSFFYEIDWKSGLKLIGPKLLVEDSWMEKQSLVINMSYYEDLSGKTLTIKYSSQNSNASSRLLFSSAFQLDFTLRDYTLPIRPANNLSPVYFSDSVYEQSQMTSSISVILSIVCICAIFAAFLLKTSFSMFQIIISLQLVLLSLGTITEMHPIMLSITQFSPIKGLRSTAIYFDNLVSPNQMLEYNIQTLGYVTSFFGNMNIMIFIQVSVILATGALYLMSKKDLSFKTATQFARRDLMLVVIFSSMNLILSLGLFTSFYPFQIIVALCALGILIAQIVHFIRYFRKYYFFDTIFDAHNSKVKKYLVAFFVCKLICALFISVLRKHTLASSIMVFIVQIVFSVIFSVIRPFINKWMNILVLCAEWVATLFVLFNMLLNLHLFESSQLQTIVSLVQISLCYTIVFFLCISLIYTIYIDYLFKKKVIPRINLQESSKITYKEQKQKERVDRKQNIISVQELSQQYDPTMAVSHETINLDILSPTKKRTHK